MSIGKTTVRNNKVEKFSSEVKQLRKEKKEIKERLKGNENNQTQTLKEYMHVQEEIKKLILHERSKKANEL